MTEITKYDLATCVAYLRPDGSMNVEPSPRGPPKRIAGHSIGAPLLSRPAPHAGEMHPDGDELLYLISGRIEVIIEEGGEQDAVGVEQVVALAPGDACIVPKGTWHRVEIREPSRLIHITPGPGGGVRFKT